MNQEESEQNEVDGMKKGADSTGKVMHNHGIITSSKRKILHPSTSNLVRWQMYI